MPTHLRLEPEMEDLLETLVPGAENDMLGATKDQIEKIESLANQPLPKFYLWFLRRMGQKMGPFSYPSLDFSATRVISSYEGKLIPTHKRYFMIAFEKNQTMPLHLFYDLENRVRDDAAVVKSQDLYGSVLAHFETFREMFAWTKFARFRVFAFPQRCRGVLIEPNGAVKSVLDPLMADLGFSTPSSLPTGPYCGLYHGAASAMQVQATPGKPPGILAFSFGGVDSRILRHIMGEIRSNSSLEVEIVEWVPALQ